MIVVVAPGQGSQTPGFLTPWLELDGVRERLEALGDAAELDLVSLGTTADADTIRRTEIAQPLIVAAGIVTAAALERTPSAVAGHSVGEVTASVVSGVLSDVDGMRLVAVRGRAMAEAAAAVLTGMSAVVGGDETAVVERLTELGLIPANRNGGGQIVAAGELAALDTLRAEPPAGTRVIPLQVAGAFHTAFMAPAVDALRGFAAGLAPADPSARLWTNKDGSEVGSGSAYLDLLVGQVASPVRWDRCMESFAAAGITGLVELAPAGTLTGLAKRGLKGVPTVAVKTPADLAAAQDLLDRTA
ncbi:ACP S-malonyltransferase [Amnibacterium kyonggiense]|uniref:[acyl-carrier-protein] S-malonyltransferase n=1 Tax=Amnibacterium kyonggiense TaxID=595671 RepID=A0A4V3EAW4_9MICO|nr:ACP S-malonyltransferase [Amnibacterium kyonggiense]TDS77554.1 [acyl-carrier-protein] S-malonyltransferase [Amnibacterium kyonggiense]